MHGNNWIGFFVVVIVAFVMMLFFLHGCASYQAYPNGHYKSKEVKVTGVVDRQVGIKYE